ncbi:unnamed protein product [Gadus morhua 'NCC']
MLRTESQMKCMVWLWLLMPVALAFLCSQQDASRCECEWVTTDQVVTMFSHVEDDLLHSNPVAPWKLKVIRDHSREPNKLQEAHCLDCPTDPLKLTPQPVCIEVNVFYRNDTVADSWCKCPCSIAVACTCVPHKQKLPPCTPRPKRG